MPEADFIYQVKEKVIIALLGDDELGERFVLKGGNLLQFAYQLTTRASKDIDISVDGDFPDAQILSDKVQACLLRVFKEMKLVLVDFSFREVPAKMSEDVKSFWGGYACEFKLVDHDKFENQKHDPEKVTRSAHALDSNGSTKFKIDFSRHEFCGDKESFEVNGFTIFGYSPRMFVAEKLRAICQQMPEYNPIVHRTRATASRARDFVDLHVISGTYGINFDDPTFHEILEKMFDKKKVPLEFLGLIKSTREQHEPDFQAVKDTVAPAYRTQLQDFDFYFKFVCDCCKKLEPLWNK